MYVQLDFSSPASADPHRDLSLLAEEATASRISGWVRIDEGRISGRALCLSNGEQATRRLLQRFLGGEDAATIRRTETRRSNPFHPEFTHFRVLEPVTKETWSRTIQGRWAFLDRVDHRGLLSGWAFDASDPATRLVIDIYANGTFISSALADKLRVDLLEKGVGDGEYGFHLDLPASLLDGGAHEIRCTARSDSGEPLPLQGAPEKRLACPFRFEVAAPWRDAASFRRVSPGAAQAPYAAFWAIKDRIIKGEGAAALDALRGEIDRHPELVFFDAGIVEARKRARAPFPSFRERLVSRFLTWPRDRLCEMGPNCCKQAGRELCAHDSIDHCLQLIRRFTSKSFTKDYCAVRGFRTPQTLLVTDDLETLRRFAFPESFVIKPDVDSGRCSFLYVDGYDLLSRRPVTIDRILKEVGAYLDRTARGEFIVEELLLQRSDGGSARNVIPVDYKLHTFGGEVRLIHVDDRNVFDSRDRLHRQQGWFAANWSPAPHRMRVNEEEAIDFERPDTLPDMIRIAQQVGRDCGDYVRVDLYDTVDGVALGEVTTFSHGGLGFTQFGDLVLSQLWEVFPRQVLPPDARSVAAAE